MDDGRGTGSRKGYGRFLNTLQSHAANQNLDSCLSCTQTQILQHILLVREHNGAKLFLCKYFP